MSPRVPESSDKTLADLEWDRISEAVAARCRGPLAERLGTLPRMETREGTERALAETAEAMTLADRGEAIRIEGAREIGQLLERLAKQGALDAPSLRDLMSTLRAGRVLRLFLARHRSVAPRLHERCALDPSLDALLDELESAIESDGTVSDNASAEVRRLRRDVANLRARLIAKFEELIRDKADILSDAFYTIRDGRYVVPLRRDTHEALPGIVHGTSSTGHSVWVEPRSLVPLGNRLKMAESELEREIARILAALSELAAERLPSMLAMVDALDHADLRAASARLGADLNARVLPLADSPRIDLRAARHPLLILDGVEVVPNDLSLAGGAALVLSGPNAGGKTVALKTLGLAALMARAGLPIPAGEGSECGFFEHVASDVGDDQNLHKNLSTFSAHVTRLVAMLDEARPGALLLLDELAGGTDPHEGAALACSLVDSFLRRGGAVAVTTHYEALKAMAVSDERLTNAAVGFDVSKMEPTFKVAVGVPGASSALDVARRFGVPGIVIERAREILPEQTRTFDTLVRGLEAARQEVEAALASARQEREEVASLRAKVEAKLEALMASDKRNVSRATSRLYEDLKKARKQIKDIRRGLREARDERALKELQDKEAAARAAVDSLRDESAGQDPTGADPQGTGPSRTPVVEAEIAVGTKVHVKRLGRDAEVVEGPAKGKVRVAAGALTLWVDVKELSASRSTATAPTSGPNRGGAGRAGVSVSTSDNTVDLRGMRVDDALALMETFLDRAFGAGESTAYVLHGVGSGALRDAVRRELNVMSSYVSSYRAGTREEGGERMTVVQLVR